MFSWNANADSTATIHSVRSMSPSTSSFGRGLLGSLTRSKLYHSLSSLDKTKMWSKFYVDDEENVQRVLDAVSTDQKVITNPLFNRKRRTVIVTRNQGQPFGFTIQSYVLKRTDEEIPEKVSYIDYVQLESPAAEAGIRAGDVIISVNGRVVTGMSHQSLIELIGSCREMRMVLIFENIRQRIELAARAIRLRKLLHDKMYQLNQIDLEEQKILSRAYTRSQSTLNGGKNSACGSLSSAGTSSGSSFKSNASRTLRSFPTSSSDSTFPQASGTQPFGANSAGASPIGAHPIGVYPIGAHPVGAEPAPLWELSSVLRPEALVRRSRRLESQQEMDLELEEPPGLDGSPSSGRGSGRSGQFPGSGQSRGLGPGPGSEYRVGIPEDEDIDSLDMDVDVDFESDVSGAEDGEEDGEREVEEAGGSDAGAGVPDAGAGVPKACGSGAGADNEDEDSQSLASTASSVEESESNSRVEMEGPVEEPPSRDRRESGEESGRKLSRESCEESCKESSSESCKELCRESSKESLRNSCRKGSKESCQKSSQESNSESRSESSSESSSESRRESCPSRHPSLELAVHEEVSAIIDSVAFQHVLRLEDGDDDCVHITKL